MAENLLTHKMGPIPTWGWLGIVTALFGSYYLYEKSKGSTAASSGTASSAAAANVPDYVFQNYNQLPPEQPAPAPASGGPVTPGGPVKGHKPGGVPDKFPHGAPTKRPETLAEISKRYKTPIPILLKLNPSLKRYAHGGKVPKGTRIKTNV